MQENCRSYGELSARRRLVCLSIARAERCREEKARMVSRCFVSRVGRGAVLSMMAGLLFGMPRRACAWEADRTRDARWASEHTDLDLLPVAYVVRPRHL